MVRQMKYEGGANPREGIIENVFEVSFSWALWRGQTSREFRCPLWVDCNNLTGQCHNKWWFVRGSAPEWGPSFRWVQPYPLKQWRQHSWILLGHGCLLKFTHNPIQKNLFKDLLYHGIPMYIHILDHFGWFESHAWNWYPILAAKYLVSMDWVLWFACNPIPSAGGGAKWCLASLPSWNGCLVGGWLISFVERSRHLQAGHFFGTIGWFF